MCSGFSYNPAIMIESSFSSSSSSRSRSSVCCCTAAGGGGGVGALLISQLKWLTRVAICLLVLYFAYVCTVVLIPVHHHRRGGAALVAHSSENFALWRSTRTTNSRRHHVELNPEATRPWRLQEGHEAAAGTSVDHGSTTILDSSSRKSNVAGVQFSAANAAGGGAPAAIRMKLVHRNSPESPFRKEYSSPAQALEEAAHMDAVRHAGFRKQRMLLAPTGREQQQLGASPAAPHAAAAATRRQGPAAAATAATADPPSATIVQNPNGPGIPATTSEQNFYSPLVSGSTLGSGQYFVNFSIGTPAQNFSLIADTGSDLIWVQCATCTMCYTQNGPLFSPSSSSSFAPVSCSSNECNLVPATPGFPCDSEFRGACAYEYQYADSSITKGVFASETATLMSSGSSSNASVIRIQNVAFGCGTQNQVSFQGAGGVMGLGQGPLSFTSQIGYAYGNKFSYCLVKFLDPVTVSSSLIFGDDSVLFTKHSLQYTPILDNPLSGTLYYVGIEEVSVAGSSLDIPSSAWSFTELGDGGTTIDSGSTLTYFVPEAYNAILAAFQQALLVQFPQVTTMQTTLDLCFNVSGVDDPQFPDFIIQFQNNAVFAPPSENYIVEVAHDVKCLAMQGLQSDFGFNTIGNLLQQNFLVVYDRQNSRIGFSRSSCASLNS